MKAFDCCSNRRYSQIPNMIRLRVLRFLKWGSIGCSESQTCSRRNRVLQHLRRFRRKEFTLCLYMLTCDETASDCGLRDFTIIKLYNDRNLTLKSDIWLFVLFFTRYHLMVNEWVTTVYSSFLGSQISLMTIAAATFFRSGYMFKFLLKTTV